QNGFSCALGATHFIGVLAWTAEQSFYEGTDFPTVINSKRQELVAGHVTVDC
ncbi:hypothetical protein Y032_0825g2547, partial [Ancylostoma ceylanicum]